VDISQLKGLVGKKLLWVGRDPETGFNYLLFDDMAAVCVDDYNVVSEASPVMIKILGENLADAQNVVDLKAIMEKQNGTQPTVSKETGRASGTPVS